MNFYRKKVLYETRRVARDTNILSCFVWSRGRVINEINSDGSQLKENIEK